MLQYLVTSASECSNIETLIPSKYLGKIDLNGKFSPSSQECDTNDFAWSEKLIDAHCDLQIFKKFPIYENHKFGYIYKNLSQGDLLLINLSISDAKINTYDEINIEAVKVFESLSVKIFHARNTAQKILKVITSDNSVEKLDELTNIFNKRISTVSTELSKIATDNEVSSVINKLREDPCILVNSDFFIDFCENLYEQNFGLRFET